MTVPLASCLRCHRACLAVLMPDGIELRNFDDDWASCPHVCEPLASCLRCHRACLAVLMPDGIKLRDLDHDWGSFPHVCEPRLFLWFQDHAEYYFVCESCYRTHCAKQWCGSTEAPHGWRGRALDDLDAWERSGRGCQFCGPTGNGGPIA